MSAARAASSRNDARCDGGGARENVGGVVGEPISPLLQPDRAEVVADSLLVRRADRDRQPRAQPQLAAFLDGHRCLGGAQRIQHAPLAQPGEHLRWSLASEDRQSSKLVGLVARAAVGEYMRARVLDAHETTGAPRDLRGEFEEVADAACLHRFGAGLDRRRLQHPQDKSIDAFPPSVWVDVDDRDGKLGDA